MPPLHLRPAAEPEFAAIENMMQFYMHDFSEWLPLPLENNGLFAVRPKAEYLARPGTLPYLILAGEELAGFAVIDDEVHQRESDYTLGYFFIARRFRGQGAGQAIVEELVRSFPGTWEIFHLKENLGAAQFWKKVVPRLSSGQFSCVEARIDDYDCTLYRFSSPQLCAR